LDATATLSGKVSAQGGKLQFSAESLQVQGFSVDSLREKAEREITKALNQWSGKLPGRIDSVRIEDKKMTIEGTTQK
jgi:hypothetical protein